MWKEAEIFMISSSVAFDMEHTHTHTYRHRYQQYSLQLVKTICSVVHRQDSSTAAPVTGDSLSLLFICHENERVCCFRVLPTHTHTGGVTAEGINFQERGEDCGSEGEIKYTFTL